MQATCSYLLKNVNVDKHMYLCICEIFQRHQPQSPAALAFCCSTSCSKLWRSKHSQSMCWSPRPEMKPKGIPCVLWFSSLLNSKAWVLWSSLRTKAHHVYLKRVGRSPQRLPPNRKLPVFVLDRPTAQSVLERSPRAWPLILQSKPSIVFSNSLRERLPDYLQGLELGLKLELCRLKPQNKVQQTVWISNSFLELQNWVVDTNPCPPDWHGVDSSSS